MKIRTLEGLAMIARRGKKVRAGKRKISARLILLLPGFVILRMLKKGIVSDEKEVKTDDK